MELIAAAHVDSPFSFEFPATDIHARQLLKLDHATLGYGDKPVLTDVDWTVLAGRAHRPARTERRGQIDAVARDRRRA